MKRFPLAMEIWLVLFAACVAVSIFCFTHVDVSMARSMWRWGHVLHPLSRPLGAPVILAIEAAVTVALIIARLLRGHLSLFAETVVIACLASICAYDINSHVLKPFFGVPNPYAVLHGARHAFHFWKGSPQSSFPSGHMVLAGSLTGVFMRVYRVSRWPLSGCLALAAGLLIVGDWHFLSDVLVGTFLGVTAGLLAGEGWLAHKKLLSMAG